MSTLSQFAGATIKSIQRGVVSGGGTATITSVNTARTELRFLGCSNSFLTVVLTNSTTITCGAGAGTVSWELTEFY